MLAPALPGQDPRPQLHPLPSWKECRARAFQGAGLVSVGYRAVLLVKAQQFLWLSLHSRTVLSDAQVLPPAPTLKGQQKPVRIPGAHFQKSLMCDNKKVTGAL